MSPKYTLTRLSDKFIWLLLLASMLFAADIEIAGFPLYSLLLFLVVLGWLTVKCFLNRQEAQPFIQLQYLTDIAAILVLPYEMLSIIGKLFQNPDDGAIDFSVNAVIIAFALLCLLFSAQIKFQGIYFDFIVYTGLLIAGAFIFYYLTEVQSDIIAKTVFRDSGAAASYLLLLCMCSVYLYCFCKDRLRSVFYFLVSVVAFFALFLNQNVLSFWLMSVYFIAIPIVLRPTAQLVKKDMQLFFVFGFMLSNMSLLTGYTHIIQKELSYSLEHSVYLDLLLALGGVFFFHYWERIPEGIDLERLVLRKMRRGYQFLIKMILILFIGIIISADKWKAPIEGMSGEAVRGFVLPLVEGIRQCDSGFFFCFQNMGIIGSIFIVVCCILFIGRLRRNFELDKPVTGILILISSIFMVQLLFWKPTVNTLTVYLILLLFAAYHKEEKVKVTSVRIRQEALVQQGMPSGIVLGNVDKRM